MPIPRAKKEQLVAEYTRLFRQVEAVIFTDYRGLTVADMNDVRRRLREAAPESRWTVAKNTLLRLALQQAERPVPEDVLVGPTAVLFAFEDPVAPAKVLKQYADENEHLKIKGGFLGDQPLSAAEIEQLATLPSREEILATLVATIQGPAQQLVSLLQAPHRELVLTLQARGNNLRNKLRERGG
ncbi:MAG: 50S ribosomal protein L10 [Ardenticatenia bacterium]|nr:50S ribosomal protein L10 [Ardenticatenia bacterium]